jgi:hypothetical protein
LPPSIVFPPFDNLPEVKKLKIIKFRSGRPALNLAIHEVTLLFKTHSCA